MIHERIKELHKAEVKMAVNTAVQGERLRVHEILKRNFQELLGTGQPSLTKLLLKIDREVLCIESSISEPLPDETLEKIQTGTFFSEIMRNEKAMEAKPQRCEESLMVSV